MVLFSEMDWLILAYTNRNVNYEYRKSNTNKSKILALRDDLQCP
jgi:hypothetical protein